MVHKKTSGKVHCYVDVAFLKRALRISNIEIEGNIFLLDCKLAWNQSIFTPLRVVEYKEDSN